MLFVGDSFTPAGMDDYCAHNRLWLGRGVGFDRCVALIEKLRPTHVFNCHVNEAFDFTPEQCRFMRRNLAEREKLFTELFPWDHPNYGSDEPWVRLEPYEQKAAPGGAVSVGVVVTNHSAEARGCACRAVLPRSWARGAGPPSPVVPDSADDWPAIEIPAKSEGTVRLAVGVPGDVEPGRYVVPVDVRYGRRVLPQFQEAIVVV
jgi:hypothetical protein